MARLLVALFMVLAAFAATGAATGAANAQTLGRERLNEAGALSHDDMAALLRGLLTGRADVGALRVEAGDIVFHAAGRDVRMGLAALSRQFNALPNARARQDAFDQLTQRVAEAVAGRPAPKTEAETRRFTAALLPVLKNRSFIAQFAEMARQRGSPHARLLHVPLFGDVIAAAALDLPNVTRFVAMGEGGGHGMSDADVLRAAIDNWTRRVDRLELHAVGNLRAFHFGTGVYNASILVLPNPWEKVPDLPRNVAFSVPSRDILAFADADDAEAVAALRALTKQPDKGFPISKQIYRLSEKGPVVIP
ncbi:MAG TPA: hypothetical protein VGN82_25780 [Bosea sp. (in: a-proteobacteria)]|jgi:hypothetical protein|uniref:hypothetical protein n=1 Tax=Bosea sp. (in: a-proteobacteria) TaxID=1871050 RepID=UPI002E10275F|nr:hypothetical protein [Bosea sp. (in: a-proteobacteria)]